MSLENLSIEDLEKEIIRRKSSQAQDIRAKILEHQKSIRELEAQIADIEGAAKRAPKARAAATVIGGSKLSPAERAEKVLAALDGKGEMAPAHIAEIVGFDGIALRSALQSLVAEKRVKQSGKARGSKYQLI